MDRHTQSDRQTHTQTHRQTDTQTDRHTDTQTDRQKDTAIVYALIPIGYTYWNRGVDSSIFKKSFEGRGKDSSRQTQTDTQTDNKTSR